MNIKDLSWWDKFLRLLFYTLQGFPKWVNFIVTIMITNISELVWARQMLILTNINIYSIDGLPKVIFSTQSIDPIRASFPLQRGER